MFPKEFPTNSHPLIRRYHVIYQKRCFLGFDTLTLFLASLRNQRSWATSNRKDLLVLPAAASALFSPQRQTVNNKKRKSDNKSICRCSEELPFITAPRSGIILPRRSGEIEFFATEQNGGKVHVSLQRQVSYHILNSKLGNEVLYCIEAFKR